MRGLRSERRGFHDVAIMKDLVKLVAFAVLVIALAPFAGFWIVALVGAGLLALPLAAVISKFCPNIWRHLEDVLASKTHFVTLR